MNDNCMTTEEQEIRETTIMT